MAVAFVVHHFLPTSFCALRQVAYVLLLGGVGVGLASLVNEYLVALNKERSILICFAGAALVFVVASFLFVREHGVLSQSVAATTSFFSLLFLNLLALWYHTGRAK